MQHLLNQGEVIKEREGEYLKSLRLWLFAHDGITKKAEELIREYDILWSSREDIDGLLEAVRLRKLPELQASEQPKTV